MKLPRFWATASRIGNTAGSRNLSRAAERSTIARRVCAAALIAAQATTLAPAASRVGTTYASETTRAMTL